MRSWSALVSLVLLGALLYLTPIDRAPFFTAQEPREAVVVQEILRSAEWVLPLRNGVELPAKPPLFHWLAAVASMTEGEVSEWSMRLPSAILAIATLLAFLLVMRGRYDLGTASVATLIVATPFAAAMLFRASIARRYAFGAVGGLALMNSASAAIFANVILPE